MMLRAVIFDMDGVLIDSEPLHGEIAVLTGKECGIPITLEDNYRFIGSSVRHMYESLIKEYHVNLSLDTVLEVNNHIKRELIKKRGYPAVPGSKELIKHLYDDGIKLAIASSSSMEDIERVTWSLGIEKYFSKRISGANLKYPKPYPDIFLHALTELSVSSKEAVVIEDSKNGIAAARAAGIAAVGYINPNSGNQDLRKANVLLESFEGIETADMIHILKRANKEPITIATTKRMIIRELKAEEMARIHEICQHPQVSRFINDMDGSVEIEIEKQKAYIDNVYGFYEYGLWGIVDRENSLLIGRCGIQNTIIDGQPEIELSYLLDYNYWGKGYASECAMAVLFYGADYLKINRIVAAIEPANHRSRSLAERIGMVFEKETIYHGKTCLLYSISNIKDTLKCIHAAKTLAFKNTIPSQYGKRFRRQED